MSNIDFLAVTQFVTVGIRFERVGLMGVDLRGVGKAIPIGIGFEGIGFGGLDLLPIRNAVTIGIGFGGVCAGREFFGVSQSVAVRIGAAGLRKILEVELLPGVSQTITVRIPAVPVSSRVTALMIAL